MLIIWHVHKWDLARMYFLAEIYNDFMCRGMIWERYSWSVFIVRWNEQGKGTLRKRKEVTQWVYVTKGWRPSQGVLDETQDSPPHRGWADVTHLSISKAWLEYVPSTWRSGQSGRYAWCLVLVQTAGYSFAVVQRKTVLQSIYIVTQEFLPWNFSSPIHLSLFRLW